MHRTAEKWIQKSEAPSDAEAFQRWIKLEDAVDLLRSDLRSDHLTVYAGVGGVFMHAVFVPSGRLAVPDYTDLMKWNANAYSSWGLCHTFGENADIWIESPLHGNGSVALAEGEQFIFCRSFDSYRGQYQSHEILQELAHLYGLFYLDERSAYCRLDDRGDLEDVVRIIRVGRDADVSGGTIVTMDRRILDEYMAVTDASIVRMFDITRCRLRAFGGWDSKVRTPETHDSDLYYRSHVEPGHASYMRGVQIIQSQMTRAKAVERYLGTEERKYESFIAQDWRNNVVREISTAPGATANYFMTSSLPFETSPAFFRPDVLLKYKSDSEKYTVKDRSINCRNSWHLQTYDVNEAGQVHTYIVYLRHLPYEEQLYWKSFNEAPKAPISSRAFASDFEGRWDQAYDPLQSIRSLVSSLNDSRPTWWHLRSEELLDAVHYPVTPSGDEWASELLNLEKVVVEGLSEKALRKNAESAGRTPDPKWRSLKLVEEVLQGLGFDEEKARSVTRPLHELHRLRSITKAHDGGAGAKAEQRKILKDYGSYQKHFRSICGECDESLAAIVEAFKGLKSRSV